MTSSNAGVLGVIPTADSKEEPTLKVILSALWNLSSHCRKNKVRFDLGPHPA